MNETKGFIRFFKILLTYYFIKIINLARCAKSRLGVAIKLVMGCWVELRPICKRKPVDLELDPPPIVGQDI